MRSCFASSIQIFAILSLLVLLGCETNGEKAACDPLSDPDCPCVNASTRLCGESQEGACQMGVQTCEDGAWGSCEGAIAPSDEVCDGVDNDCDGATDEDLIAPACSLQVGVCEGAVQVCSGTEAGWSTCTAAEYGSDYVADEDTAVDGSLCDGLDNDCDGTVDEGCLCTSDEIRPCGQSEGACVEGIQTCVDGTWSDCEGDVGPSVEICDGVDNDCDGQVDNGVIAPACSLQYGVCAGSEQSCGGAEGWMMCDAATYGSDYVVDEDTAVDGSLCDGLDNDCDGVIDEGCTCVNGETQSCGASEGQCVPGTTTCSNGQWGDCIDEVAPTPEVCNGLDDDCDGTTDENLIQTCGTNVGECQFGTRSCSDGMWGSCQGSVDPTPEVCNGLDDDCDGVVDNGVRNTYYRDADGDGYGSIHTTTEGCTAPPGYVSDHTDCDDSSSMVNPSQPEVCDGLLDNNCDGTVDEECVCTSGETRSCGSSTVGACWLGTQTCVGGTWGSCIGSVEPTLEVCNGVDDDCDGTIDEGC